MYNRSVWVLPVVVKNVHVGTLNIAVFHVLLAITIVWDNYEHFSVAKNQLFHMVCVIITKCFFYANSHYD